MTKIVKFPVQLRTISTNPAARQIATAERLSSFLVRAAAVLEPVVDDIAGDLQTMDDDAVNTIFCALQDVLNSGQASTEEIMLDEIVTSEFERRCLLAGTPAPWTQDYRDTVPANDQPEPNGAA